MLVKVAVRQALDLIQLLPLPRFIENLDTILDLIGANLLRDLHSFFKKSYELAVDSVNLRAVFPQITHRIFLFLLPSCFRHLYAAGKTV